MKRILFAVILFSVVSCDNKDIVEDLKSATTTEENVSSDKQSPKVVKRWILKERRNATGDKSIAFDDDPTDVVLAIKEDGYFIEYDSLTNEDWIEKGLKRMETRSKGQWELKDNTLILTHISDNNTKTEVLNISELSDDKLVTENEKKDIYTYYSTY